MNRVQLLVGGKDGQEQAESSRAPEQLARHESLAAHARVDDFQLALDRGPEDAVAQHQALDRSDQILEQGTQGGIQHCPREQRRQRLRADRALVMQARADVEAPQALLEGGPRLKQWHA